MKSEWSEIIEISDRLSNLSQEEMLKQTHEELKKIQNHEYNLLVEAIIMVTTLRDANCKRK